MTAAATQARVPGAALIGGFVGAAALVAVLAVRLSVPLTVMGLALFGAAHVAFELRYVLGRCAPAVAGRLGWLFLLVLSLVVAARLTAVPLVAFGRPAEVIMGHLVLAVGVAAWLQGRRRVLGFVLVAASALAALLWQGWFFFVLTHAHNLVPVAFLWDWSAQLPARTRTWFRTVQLTWAFGVPLLAMTGAFDAVTTLGTPLVSWLVGDGSAIVGAAAPPGASALVAARFSVAFAFGQTMHYLVWLVFFPVFARSTTARFEATFPRLRGWRFPVLVLVLALLVASLFVTEWSEGRLLYGSLAAYHVYLEFPLLVGLWWSRRTPGFAPPSVGAGATASAGVVGG